MFVSSRKWQERITKKYIIYILERKWYVKNDLDPIISGENP